MDGDEFLSDLQRVLQRGLLRSRGPSGLRPWKNIANHERNGSGIFNRSIEVKYEFSSLPPGAFLLPHTDKPAKLVSLLFYVSDSQWRSEYGGQTEFYQAKQPLHDRKWSNHKVPMQAVDTVFRAEFKPNRLVGFVKSKNSYHGVSPLTSPQGTFRKSFNFNISVPFAVRGNIPHRAFESFCRRTESGRFRMFVEENRKAAEQGYD